MPYTDEGKICKIQPLTEVALAYRWEKMCWFLNGKSGAAEPRITKVEVAALNGDAES